MTAEKFNKHLEFIQKETVETLKLPVSPVGHGQ